MNTSHRKSTQVHSRLYQTEMQVEALSLLASVWPALNTENSPDDYLCILKVNWVAMQPRVGSNVWAHIIKYPAALQHVEKQMKCATGRVTL